MSSSTRSSGVPGLSVILNDEPISCWWPQIEMISPGWARWSHVDDAMPSVMSAKSATVAPHIAISPFPTKPANGPWSSMSFCTAASRSHSGPGLARRARDLGRAEIQGEVDRVERSAGGGEIVGVGEVEEQRRLIGWDVGGLGLVVVVDLHDEEVVGGDGDPDVGGQHGRVLARCPAHDLLRLTGAAETGEPGAGPPDVGVRGLDRRRGLAGRLPRRGTAGRGGPPRSGRARTRTR